MYDTIVNFLRENWFNLIQTGGIVFSILWSAHLINLNRQTVRVSNYLLLTQYHRDVWKIVIDHPKYYDNLFVKQKNRMTIPEKQFLTFVFLHIVCTFELIKNKQVTNIEAIQFDIGEMMTSKPVNKFWESSKRYYNQDFISFIQSCKQYYSDKINFADKSLKKSYQ